MVDWDLIEASLDQEENTCLEFKETVALRNEKEKNELAKDICALANTRGGLIIIGVRDKKHERGIIILSEEPNRESIIQAMSHRIVPPAPFEVGSKLLRAGPITVIRVDEGNEVHQVNQTVYVRRDCVVDKATPEEIRRLAEIRHDRTFLVEPTPPEIEERDVIIFGEGKYSYRITKKMGGLFPLSTAPLFLPDISVNMQPLSFGRQSVPLEISYYVHGDLDQDRFIENCKKIEKELLSFNAYIDFELDGLFWTISNDGILAYGFGTENVAKALSDDNWGIVALGAIGEMRGAPNLGACLLLIDGYAKTKKDGKFLLQDVQVSLFLSCIPFTTDWIRRIFSKFMDSNSMSVEVLGYEPAEMQSCKWTPIRLRHRTAIPKVKGCLARYGSRSRVNQVSGFITDTAPFRAWEYSSQTFGTLHKESFFGREFETDTPAGRIFPLDCLEESVITITNGVPSFEEAESGELRTFSAPHVIEHVFSRAGHTVHVLGINSFPRFKGEMRGRRKNKKAFLDLPTGINVLTAPKVKPRKTHPTKV